MKKDTITASSQDNNENLVHFAKTIKNEQEHKDVKSILTEGRQPSTILRFLMQRFENYRQSKKMGWSRSWNKNHVVNFQSFKLNTKDSELKQLALQVIAAEWPEIPPAANQFVQELLAGETAPMGFVFFQELNDEGQIYEGAVLSYGRINSDNRRFRDRLDIVLESPINNANSEGLSRVRLYIDPYLQDQQPLWSGQKQSAFKPATEQLFDKLTTVSWDWAEDKSRLWEHWVTQYIDFFGPRKTPVKASYFHVAGQPDCRISKGAITPDKSHQAA